MNALVQRIDAWTAAVSRRLFGPIAPEVDAGLASFAAEADAVMSRQRTQRAQAIVRTAVVVVLLLIVWAALARAAAGGATVVIATHDSRRAATSVDVMLTLEAPAP